MRFCHVTTFYPPWNFGGDGIAIRTICEALANRGHEVDVVHCVDAYELRGHRAVRQPADSSRVRRHAIRSPLGRLSPLITQQTGRPGPKRQQLEKILADGYDVVHFHNISLIGGPGVLPLSRAPVTLYTTHDHWLLCPTHVLWKNRSGPCDRPTCLTCSLRSGIPPQAWRYTNLLERGLRHVDALLCPSDYSAQRHRAAGITRPIHVHRWFPRVGAEPDKPIRGPATETDPRPLFAYSGRLVASKGVEALLEAFAPRPDYRLVLAGDGALAGPLRRRFQAAEHIRFAGEVHAAELERLLRRATAVIVPSWGPEVLALSAVEALACGTPVIVRRAGGSAESVELTGGGLIYDRPEQLMPLVDRLAADSRLRATLAARALTGCRLHFSEERWMTRYFEIIDRIARAKATTETVESRIA